MWHLIPLSDHRIHVRSGDEHRHVRLTALSHGCQYHLTRISSVRVVGVVFAFIDARLFDHEFVEP